MELIGNRCDVDITDTPGTMYASMMIDHLRFGCDEEVERG
jgi:hypothetical protein